MFLFLRLLLCSLLCAMSLAVNGFLDQRGDSMVSIRAVAAVASIAVLVVVALGVIVCSLLLLSLLLPLPLCFFFLQSFFFGISTQCAPFL